MSATTIPTTADRIPIPPPIAPGGTNLEALARRFATLDRVAAELLIDAYVVQAIAQWRVTDATFWQRVKYRSRLMRATAAGQAGR